MGQKMDFVLYGLNIRQCERIYVLLFVNLALVNFTCVVSTNI
jgi:hypothetical protein